MNGTSSPAPVIGIATGAAPSAIERAFATPEARAELIRQVIIGVASAAAAYVLLNRWKVFK